MKLTLTHLILAILATTAASELSIREPERGLKSKKAKAAKKSKKSKDVVVPKQTKEGNGLSNGGDNNNDDELDSSSLFDCLGAGGIMETITCFFGSVYPPIIEGALAKFDPIELGEGWSQTIAIDVPSCPSTLSVEFDLGSIRGLSSLDLQGLVLTSQDLNCANLFCLSGTFTGVFTEYVMLRSIEAGSSASLIGNISCLGDIVDAQLSGTTSLNGPGLGIEIHAEGSFSTGFGGLGAEITKLSVEKIDLEEGTIDAGISFSAWGNEFIDFESTFENFLPNEIELYLEDIVKNNINLSLDSTLPISFP